MTKDNETAGWLPAFDELGNELARVAEADAAEPPRRRRWVIAVAALSLVATPAALAAGGAFDGDHSVSIEEPGKDVKVDGEQIDCPEDGKAFVQELGSDPCEAFTIEAAPPRSVGPENAGE